MCFSTERLQNLGLALARTNAFEVTFSGEILSGLLVIGAQKFLRICCTPITEISSASRMGYETKTGGGEPPAFCSIAFDSDLFCWLVLADVQSL